MLLKNKQTNKNILLKIEWLNQDKKTEITPCIYSDHKTMKLEVNHKKKFGKTTNTWRFKNILLKKEEVNQEIKEEI